MTHSTFPYPYLGVLLLLVIAVVVFSGVLYLQRIISRALAKKDREKLKLSPYESGVLPNMQKNTISAHFFLLALLFILFDIEVIFMIPWAIEMMAAGGSRYDLDRLGTIATIYQIKASLHAQSLAHSVRI